MISTEIVSNVMTEDPKTFVDTNVLLYAYDASEAVKQPVAQAALEMLWARRAGTLSTQVLQEFYSVATRKLTMPMTRAEAREVVSLYDAWPVVLLDPTLIVAATRVEEEYQLSFWDALVVEAARVAGSERLLTEDLQDGLVIAGVRIENPFTPAGVTGPHEGQTPSKQAPGARPVVDEDEDSEMPWELPRDVEPNSS